MFNIIIYLNVLLSFFLIFFILINKGKNISIDPISSSSVNAVFGGKGSNSFLNKIIILIAILLLLFNISINFLNPKVFKKEGVPLVNISEYSSDLNSKEKK